MERIGHVRKHRSFPFPQLSSRTDREAGRHLQAAPQCLGYELSACEDEPATLILRIIWTSTKDHLEGFRKETHFPPFLQIVRPFIEEIEEMRHYTLTDLQWAR